MSKFSSSTNYNNVRVIARTRPTTKFARDLISLESDGKTVTACLPKREGLPSCYLENVQQKWSFKLDKYLHEAGQDQVFDECGRSQISHVLEGYNATLMAYGQTGAGKSYTMTGSSAHFDERGIIPRAVSHLFKEVASRPELNIRIRVSYLEIYNDNVHDLLSNMAASTKKQISSLPASRHTICEDESGNIYVKGLTIRPAENEEEVLNMLFEGETHRAISGHSLNPHSSRSHCIFTIYVEVRSRTDSKYTVSKLNLVDLAGSERIGKTHAQGDTQIEARYINKSLSFLEQVALALTEKGRDFVPYRQSKLTHYLKDSLGGNCCTVVIANIWPEAEQIEETICTLRFASRIMRVSNNPVQNTLHDPQRLIKEQEEEIKMLRMELAMHNTILGKPSISYEPLSEVEQQDVEHNIRLYISGAIPELEVKSVRQVKEIFQRFKNLVISTERSLTQSTCSFNNIEMHTPTQPSTADTQQSHKRVSIATKRSKRHTTTSVTYSESEPEQPAQDNRVGDTDGAGFGLGKASTDIKSTQSLMAAVKKVAKSSAVKSKGKDEIRVAVDADMERSSALSEECPQAPPKEEEFEKFKKGRGKKINAVFLSNKEQYLGKKKVCTELSEAINELKSDIGKEMKYVNELKKENEAKRMFPLASESGEAIIEEVEFQALRQLNKLKAEYRKKYEEFKEEQECMRMVKQYMDRSRSKLLLEFEEWYRVCYIGGEVLEEEESETKRAMNDRERFDKHQSTLLKDDPSTTAFYNAQIRTQQRLQTNPIRKQTRKPGQVMVSVSNRPPGVMAIV